MKVITTRSTEWHVPSEAIGTRSDGVEGVGWIHFETMGHAIEWCVAAYHREVQAFTGLQEPDAEWEITGKGVTLRLRDEQVGTV